VIHAAPPPALVAYANPTPIQYVIVIVQEGRGFNNLWAGNPPTGVTSTTTSGLSAISLGSASNVCGNPQHNYAQFLTTYDGGLMDGWNSISVTGSCGTLVTPKSYVNASEIVTYRNYANAYAISDQTYQPNMGSTASGVCYLFAGHCGGYATGNNDFSDNPIGATEYWGCNSAGGTTAAYVPMNAAFPGTTGTAYPCIASDAPQIATELDAAGVSWRWYYPTDNPRVCAPCAFTDIWNGSDKSNIVSPDTAILTDLANGTLAQVSWDPGDLTTNDDAPEQSGQAASNGPARVSAVVAAAQKSKYWPNLAIFIVWGNEGNWYDSVTYLPPQPTDPFLASGQNPIQNGYRVPLIVVSPFAKAGYIDHTPRDTTSIIRFIEYAFALVSPSCLGCVPGNSLAGYEPDNMSQFFNFSQYGNRWMYEPHSPQTIASATKGKP